MRVSFDATEYGAIMTQMAKLLILSDRKPGEGMSQLVNEFAFAFAFATGDILLFGH